MKLFNEFEDMHPMEFAFAFKGKGSKGPSKAQIAAEEAQKKELADLQAKEDSRKDAMARGRRGRASLISGEETGLKDNLGA